MARLSEKVRPCEYFIDLKTNFDSFSFDGRCTIVFDVVGDADEIAIHAAELKIQQISVPNESEVAFMYDEKNQLLSIKPKNALGSGRNELTVVYVGQLNDKMRGFYRSKTTFNGNSYCYASTHFEATGARYCFPCFDEPEMKAIFNFSITAARDQVVLSCMPEVRVETVSPDAGNEFGLSKHVFHPTPIMSSYITAIAVGYFDFVSASTSNGLEIRVFTPPGKSANGRFALDVAVKAIEFYEGFFEIKYQLPKLDLIAIADYPIGAMENWGLITFKEVSSVDNLMYIALVVCHELAHMWFGNLVTMKWWSDLWLKEGFATFMEYLAVESIFPNWPVWQYFNLSEQRTAFNLDMMDSSHPIQVTVRTPAEIDEIFDVISYRKGCSVIYMIRNYLGDEVFRRSLVSYLNKFKYSNAVTDDLWAAMSEESGIDVKAIMDSFTTRQGYPHVIVSETGVKQVAMNKGQEGMLWNLPLRYRDAKGVEHKLVLSEESASLAEKPSIMNLHSSAFCCVSYARSLEQEILSNIDKHGVIHALSICGDIFALALGGRPITDYLRALQELGSINDTNFVESVVACLRKISWICSDDLALMAAYRSFCCRYFRRLLFGEEQAAGDTSDGVRAFVMNAFSSSSANEDVFCKGHVGKLLSSLVRFDDEVVINALSDAYSSDKSCVSTQPDLQPSVYAAVVKRNGWETMVNVHDSSDMMQTKQRVINAMGNSNDPKLLQFLLSDRIRNNSAVFGFIAFAGSSASGFDAFWAFFKKEWLVFKEQYGSSTMLSRIVKACLSSCPSLEVVEDIKTFFGAQPDHGVEMALSQAIEVVVQRHNWKGKQLAHLKEFLSNVE